MKWFHNTVILKYALSAIALLLMSAPGCDDDPAGHRQPSTNNTAGTVVNNADWEPPIAIPMPEFGIRETVENLYGASNYYTHYVDNTHPDSTDEENPRGTLERPRRTIPSDVPAGSVVQISGGPYKNENTLYLRESGTADQPIILRGDPQNLPVVNRALSIRGAYIIVEFIDFNYDNGTSNISIRPETSPEATPLHHVVIRGCELHNYNSDFGATGNSSMIGVSNPNNNNGEYVHNIVIWANWIHDNGDATLAERDIHGVGIGANVQHLWMVDNHLHNNSGDAVQIAYYNTPPVNISNNIYIGRNHMHEDQENAIDLKGCRDVIISQNRIHSYSGESQGVAVGYGVGIVIHEADEHAENVLVLYNEIWDCTASGIHVSHETDNIYLVGNLIHHNIFAGTDDHAPTSPWYPGVGILVRNSGATWVWNNLITQTHHGIVDTGSGAHTITVQNNIITDLNSGENGAHLYIESSDVASGAPLDHNLYHQPGLPMSVKLGSSTAITAVGDLPSNAHSSLNEDPQYTNPLLEQYEPLPGSPAGDAGIDMGAALQTAMGVLLELDYNGDPRESGSAWDLGPWEIQ